MIRTYIFPILLALASILLIDSCKCNKPDETCPDCRANEVCEEGNCICPEGHDYRYGECVELGSASSSDSSRSFGNKFIAMQGCFTFDSTIMSFSSTFFDRLTDTTSPTPILAEGAIIHKYYKKRTDQYSGIGVFQHQNVRSYHDAWGRHVEFELGYGLKYYRIDGNRSTLAPTFWPTPEYLDILGDVENPDQGGISTKWHGLFSPDRDTIYFDIKLMWDADSTYFRETVLDSCTMVYHRLK